MRVPLIHVLPWQTRGSTEIRSRQFIPLPLIFSWEGFYILQPAHGRPLKRIPFDPVLFMLVTLDTTLQVAEVTA